MPIGRKLLIGAAAGLPIAALSAAVLARGRGGAGGASLPGWVDPQSLPDLDVWNMGSSPAPDPSMESRIEDYQNAMAPAYESGLTGDAADLQNYKHRVYIDSMSPSQTIDLTDEPEVIQPTDRFTLDNLRNSRIGQFVKNQIDTFQTEPEPYTLDDFRNSGLGRFLGIQEPVVDKPSYVDRGINALGLSNYELDTDLLQQLRDGASMEEQFWSPDNQAIRAEMARRANRAATFGR